MVGFVYCCCWFGCGYLFDLIWCTCLGVLIWFGACFFIELVGCFLLLDLFDWFLCVWVLLFWMLCSVVVCVVFWGIWIVLSLCCGWLDEFAWVVFYIGGFDLLC